MEVNVASPELPYFLKQSKKRRFMEGMCYSKKYIEIL